MSLVRERCINMENPYDLVNNALQILISIHHIFYFVAKLVKSLEM